MFLSLLLFPFALYAVSVSAVPTETSLTVEDGMASPKPSVDTAMESDAATSYLVDSPTSESSASTSISTIISTMQTATTPETLTTTLISSTSGSVVPLEPSDLWIPDTVSSTSSCTDDDKSKTKTNPPHPNHTHNPHHSSFHTKTKTHIKPSHSNPVVTPCTVPYKFPIATSNAYRSEIATNSPACAVPFLNRLLRRCIPTYPVPLPSPEPYPSSRLCLAPPLSIGTGLPTSTSESTSLSSSEEPEMKTMVETSLADGYTMSPTAVASVSPSVSESVQIPVETFQAVPEEEVPGGGGEEEEGEGGKEPVCGKGMGAEACPPVDGDM